MHRAEEHSEFFIPWDQVILACADHMVAYLNSDLWVTSFYDDGNGEKFPNPPEWIEAQAATTIATVDRLTSKTIPGNFRKYACSYCILTLFIRLDCF